MTKKTNNKHEAAGLNVCGVGEVEWRGGVCLIEGLSESDRFNPVRIPELEGRRPAERLHIHDNRL